MSRRYYGLPPLTALAAFEAAGRHQSFKQAAQELSVTPGAVSHQIRALEADLETPLFARHHRGVALTSEGEALWATLSGAFTRISQSLQVIRSQRTAHMVAIGSTSAVSALFLSPAVIRFWRDFPDANINQIVHDRPLREMHELDMYIRYAREKETPYEQTQLYRDHLVPVASPDLADRLSGCDLASLAQERLIYLDSEDKSWTGWREWFAQLGYTGPMASGLRVNNYSVALEAAREGAGIALGWRMLIAPLLRSTKLAAIQPHSLVAPHGFHLICRPDENLSVTGRALRDWIIEGANRRSRDMNSPQS